MPASAMPTPTRPAAAVATSGHLIQLQTGLWSLRPFANNIWKRTAVIRSRGLKRAPRGRPLSAAPVLVGAISWSGFR